LLHFSTGTAHEDMVLASDAGLNDRAPHLAAYGADRLLAAWEISTAKGDLEPGDRNRRLCVLTLDAATVAAEGDPFQISGVTGNRYPVVRDRTSHHSGGDHSSEWPRPPAAGA
jgi:hypothetical protein